VPPPPSQVNIPAPFPFAPPGVLGAVPGFGGFPGLTLPGAFGPNIATFRGTALEFHPTLHLGEQYTDNFFEATSGAETNYRSILGPGFVGLLRGARTFGVLSVTGDLVHDTASHSGDEVKAYPSANLALRYVLEPRLSLTVTDTFVRNDSATIVDQFGIRRGRQIYDTNLFSLAMDWILDRIVTQAYYRNALFVNEGGLQGTGIGGTINQGNSDTNIFGVNASTRIGTDYTVRVGYEFSETNEFGTTGTTNAGNTTTNTGFASLLRQFGLYASGGLQTSYSYQTQNNTKIWNGSILGAYGLPTGLSLSARLGYSLLNSDTQSTEGRFAGNATASYRFTRAIMSVGVSQDFQQTAQQGQNFGTVQSTSYFGNFLYQFTPFINASLQARYSENTGTGTGNSQTGGTQTALTYGATVNWQVLRWLVASVNYTWIQQTGGNVFGSTSSPTTGVGNLNGNFTENRAMLNLFATF
jgi:hypothetical protein